jgi:hypothetical protein
MKPCGRDQPGTSIDAEATGATTHVDFLLDTSVIARIKALMPALATPGRKATLSDALRALIHAGLGEMERGRPELSAHRAPPPDRRRRRAREPRRGVVERSGSLRA